MRVTLKRGNDQVVTLTGLRTTTQPPTYLNAATVKATLHDPKGQPMPAYSDIPMVYIADSNGNYEWQIASELMMLPPSNDYSMVLTAKQDELDYRVVHVVSVVD